jgi:hypothetical protein
MKILVIGGTGLVVDTILSSARQAAEMMEVFHGVAGRVIVLSSQDVYRAYGILVGLEQIPLQAVPITAGAASPIVGVVSL